MALFFYWLRQTRDSDVLIEAGRLCAGYNGIVEHSVGMRLACSRAEEPLAALAIPPLPATPSTRTLAAGELPSCILKLVNVLWDLTWKKNNN